MNNNNNSLFTHNALGLWDMCDTSDAELMLEAQIPKNFSFNIDSKLHKHINTHSHTDTTVDI